LSGAEKTLKFGDEKFALYMRRQYDRATTAFSRLQTEDGADGLCHFVDLSNIFADDPRNLFWDFIHVNNDGNATIGSAIAADLAKSLLSGRMH
jgi:lysophospholipase L1-like esterase